MTKYLYQLSDYGDQEQSLKLITRIPSGDSVDDLHYEIIDGVHKGISGMEGEYGLGLDFNHHMITNSIIFETEGKKFYTLELPIGEETKVTSKQVVSEGKLIKNVQQLNSVLGKLPELNTEANNPEPQGTSLELICNKFC